MTPIPEIKGYSPAPWEVDVDEDGMKIFPVKGGRVIAVVDTSKDHGKSISPNADILALAPTLYERCIELEKENERLKGLIEKAHLIGYAIPKGQTAYNSFQQFKIKNNL